MTGKACVSEHISDKSLAILEHLQENSPETLLADGWDFALIGLSERKGHVLAVYDANRIIRTLMARDGMDEMSAIEYFEFNINGAWVGEGTPVYVSLASRGS